MRLYSTLGGTTGYCLRLISPRACSSLSSRLSTRGVTGVPRAATIADLRKSPYRGNATYADVLALARASRGEDLDGYREELIQLTETARGLSGEAPPAVAGK